MRRSSLARIAVSRLGRRGDRRPPMATRAVQRPSATRDVGRGSRNDAFLVLQSDRQSREGCAAASKLSGRWSFSSGCDHCKGVNLGAIAGSRDIGGGHVPDFRSFLLLRGQYRIEDNWHVAGLKGTGQQRHRGRGRVRARLSNPVSPRLRDESPAARSGTQRGPLYRLPWSVVFNMALAASVLGLGARLRGNVDRTSQGPVS